MAANWFWIGIIALGIWLILFRRRDSQVPPPINLLPQSRPHVLSSEERSIREALEARDALNDEFIADMRARDEATRTVAEKLDRARRIIEETEIDSAVPRLWARVSDWRSFEGGPVEDDIPAEFAEVAVGGERESPWVAWKWRGQIYRLCCSDPYGDPEISLSVNDNVVLAMSCSVSGDPLHYKFSLLSAFSVGPWMAEVVRMDGLLERKSNRFMHEMMAEFDQETASRIDLGEGMRKPDHD